MQSGPDHYACTPLSCSCVALDISRSEELLFLLCFQSLWIKFTYLCKKKFLKNHPIFNFNIQS